MQCMMAYMRMHSDLCDARPRRGISSRQHPPGHRLHRERLQECASPVARVDAPLSAEPNRLQLFHMPPACTCIYLYLVHAERIHKKMTDIRPCILQASHSLPPCWKGKWLSRTNQRVMARRRSDSSGSGTASCGLVFAANPYRGGSTVYDHSLMMPLSGLVLTWRWFGILFACIGRRACRPRGADPYGIDENHALRDKYLFLMDEPRGHL